MKKGHTNNPNGRPKGATNIDKYKLWSDQFNDLIGSFKSGRSYVYYHIDDETDEVFYIGKGRNNRAWDKTKHGRNSLWMKYVSLIDSYSVRVICSNISNSEALAIESALILNRQPSCNIRCK